MRRLLRSSLAYVFIAVAMPLALRADDALDQYTVAADHYAGERWQLARDEFADFLKRFPVHAKADQARLYCGEACVQLGEFDAARRHFAELLDRKPADILAKQALFRRGEAALLIEQDSEVREDLEKFLKLYPRDEHIAYVVPYLGEISLRGGDAKAARGYFEQALTQFPKGPLVDECRFGVARTQELAGELDKAQAVYEALSADVYAPVADKALFQLGMLHNSAGRYDAALAAFDQFLKQFKETPLRPQVELTRGWSLYKLGRFAEAREALAAMTTQKDFAFEARYWIGLCHASEQHWTDAVDEFTTLEKLDPVHRLQPAVAFNLGDVLRQSGKLAEARDQFDALLKQWPDNMYADDAQFGKLQIAIKENQHDDAIALANEFLEKYSGSSLGVEAECLSTIAVCHARQAELAEAEQALDRLTEKFAKNDLVPPTIYELAQKSLEAGEAERAHRLFERLQDERYSDEWRSRGLAGLSLREVGDADSKGSAAAFERLLKEHAGKPLVATAALMRGRAMEAGGQQDAALALYERVINDYPKTDEAPQAMFRAAIVHDKLHHAEEAAALYTKLIEVQPQFAELPAALHNFGCLQYERGRRDEAIELWQRVRKDFADDDAWFDATYRLALAQFDRKDFDAAGSLLDELDSKPPKPTLTPHALYLRGRIATAREAWDQVARPLAKLQADFPEHALALPAAYWIAEASYRRGDFAAAEEQFSKLQQKATGRDESWIPMIPLRRAQSLAQQDKWTEALELAQQIERDYPQFESQYEADYLIGRCQANAADFKAAREAYDKVVHSERSSKTETAAMAQWMIGETYFHQEDYTAALRAYLRVEPLYPYPRWQAAALLQAGKCHERLGETRQAAKLYSKLLTTYPNSEFSEEATQRLGAANKNTRDDRRS